MNSCRSCGAAVRWVVTAAGRKRMPVDLEPRDDGNIEVDADGLAHYVDPEQPPLLPGERYVSHFATCRQAGEWRRR